MQLIFGPVSRFSALALLFLFSACQNTITPPVTSKEATGGQTSTEGFDPNPDLEISESPSFTGAPVVTTIPPVGGGSNVQITGKVSLFGNPAAGVESWVILSTTNVGVLAPGYYAVKTKSDAGGNYAFTVPTTSQKYFIFAWRDGNEDGIVNGGDFVSPSAPSLNGLPLSLSNVITTNITLYYLCEMKHKLYYSNVSDPNASTTEYLWLENRLRFSGSTEFLSSLKITAARYPTFCVSIRGLLLSPFPTSEMRRGGWVDLNGDGKVNAEEPFGISPYRTVRCVAGNLAASTVDFGTIILTPQLAL